MPRVLSPPPPLQATLSTGHGAISLRGEGRPQQPAPRSRETPEVPTMGLGLGLGSGARRPVCLVPTGVTWQSHSSPSLPFLTCKKGGTTVSLPKADGSGWKTGLRTVPLPHHVLAAHPPADRADSGRFVPIRADRAKIWPDSDLFWPPFCTTFPYLDAN